LTTSTPSQSQHPHAAKAADLSQALGGLVAVTKRRGDMDHVDVGLWTRRLVQSLKALPAAAALAAIDAWPRQADGQWLPSEAELMALAHQLEADAVTATERRRVQAAAVAEQVGADQAKKRPVYSCPVGASEQFVDAVREMHGRAYAETWLAGGINCLFRNDEVITTSVGAHRLRGDCWALIDRLNIQITVSAQAVRLLEAYLERTLLDPPARPGPKRRRQQYAD